MDLLGATWREWWSATLHFVPQLGLILIILVLSIVTSRRVQQLVLGFSGHTQAPPEIGVLLGRLARLGVLLVGMLLVLQELGWLTAALGVMTGLGIVGILAGFALQDIVKQFAAGILLLMLRPFRVGDLIRVDVFEGHVVEIQFRTTVLRTTDGDEVLIPNSEIYNNTVINKTRYSMHRHTVTLSIERSLDAATLQNALHQAVAAVPGVSSNPAPSIFLTGIDNEKTPLEVRFWVDTQKVNPDSVTSQVVHATQGVLAQLMPPDTAD